MIEVCTFCKQPVEKSEDAAICRNPKCRKYQEVVLIDLIEEKDEEE